MVPVVLSKSTLFLALFFVEFTPNLLAGVALRPRPTGTNNRAVHCRRRRRRRCTLFSLSLSLSLFLFRFRANRWLAGVIGSRHHNGRNVEEHACHRTNWGEAGVSAIFLISGHLRFSPRWFLDQKHTYIERERERKHGIRDCYVKTRFWRLIANVGQQTRNFSFARRTNRSTWPVWLVSSPPAIDTQVLLAPRAEFRCRMTLAHSLSRWWESCCFIRRISFDQSLLILYSPRTIGNFCNSKNIVTLLISMFVVHS